MPKVSPSTTRRASTSKRIRPLSVWTSVSPVKQGLDALMRPDSGVVCQSLMVVSYCIPGSAHSQAAWATSRISSRACTVSMVRPSSTALRSNGRSCSQACMKSSVTRTELLAFWYWMLIESRPSRSMSKPASRSTRALCSSRALHQMKSRMSGWSTLRTSILAARRLLRGADGRHVDAGPGAALEDEPLLHVPVEDGGHGVLDRQDEAVVHPHVVRQVLAAVGLDVVHRLHAPVLDREDLFLAQVGAVLAVEVEGGRQPRRLVGRQESDLLGEPDPLRPQVDLDLVQVRPVGARLELAQATRVDAQAQQQDLQVLGPALADH